MQGALTRRNRRTSDLFHGIAARPFGPTLLRNEAVFQIMFRTSASSADVAFPRLFPTCITRRVLRRAITDEMTRLYARG